MKKDEISLLNPLSMFWFILFYTYFFSSCQIYQYLPFIYIDLKPSKSTIRINLELMPTYNLIELIPPPHRFITLPNNSSSHSIMNNLNKLDIKTTS